MSEQNGNGEARSSRRLLSVYLFGRQRLLGSAELGSALDVTTEFVLGRSAQTRKNARRAQLPPGNDLRHQSPLICRRKVNCPLVEF